MRRVLVVSLAAFLVPVGVSAQFVSSSENVDAAPYMVRGHKNYVISGFNINCASMQMGSEQQDVWSGISPGEFGTVVQIDVLSPLGNLVHSIVTRARHSSIAYTYGSLGRSTTVRLWPDCYYSYDVDGHRFLLGLLANEPETEANTEGVLWHFFEEGLEGYTAAVTVLYRAPRHR